MLTVAKIQAYYVAIYAANNPPPINNDKTSHTLKKQISLTKNGNYFLNAQNASSTKWNAHKQHNIYTNIYIGSSAFYYE